MIIQYEPSWIKNKNVPLCEKCGFEAHESITILDKECCRDCAKEEYENLKECLSGEEK